MRHYIIKVYLRHVISHGKVFLNEDANVTLPYLLYFIDSTYEVTTDQTKAKSFGS
jgi:hypothetical protein